MSIFIIYSVLCFVLVFTCAKISYKLNLLDIPNQRKIHKESVAYTGGIAISVTLVSSIFLFNIYDGSLNNILSIAFLISLVGLVDDKFNLNVSGKLSLQILPIFYLVVFENLNLMHLGDYEFFIIQLGTFKIPFTLLSVLFLINSFNYFDGMDGTLSLTSISVLIILLFLYPDPSFQLFVIIILIPISIFLIFNFSFFKLPKLFLGDSGSLLIGFIIAFILIYLANQNVVHPILLAWSIAIYVYEFLSINFIRLKKQKNPFKAGQDHLHHMLFRKTKSVLISNILICFTSIAFFTIGYFSFLVSSILSLILFIFLFVIFLIVRMMYSKEKNEIKFNN